MISPLSVIEVRVLGALIEKQITTPEYYPLTLNALTNACNQKNNRNPVVSFEETTVVRAIESLREKNLIITVTGAGIRVPKYKHNAVATFDLTPQETAIMCLLMLRGPQTVGELRGRATSMHNFESAEAVEKTLEELSTKVNGPLTRKLPRQMGQKEIRHMHLLAGEPETAVEEQTSRLEPATLQVRAENERIAALEKEVELLKAQLKALQKQLMEFKKQFE